VAHGNFEQGFDVGANNGLLYEDVTFKKCNSYENRKEGFKLAGDNMKSLKIDTSVSRDNGEYSFTIQEGVQDSTVRKLRGRGNQFGFKISAKRGRPLQNITIESCDIGADRNLIRVVSDVGKVVFRDN